MSSIEQKNAERTSPAGDEGKKNELDLSKESLDAEKLKEIKESSPEFNEQKEKVAQAQLDGIADGGGDGDDDGDKKPDNFAEQSIEPSENVNEIKESSPEYKEAQKESEAQAHLDDIADK